MFLPENAVKHLPAAGNRKSCFEAILTVLGSQLFAMQCGSFVSVASSKKRIEYRKYFYLTISKKKVLWFASFSLYELRQAVFFSWASIYHPQMKDSLSWFERNLPSLRFYIRFITHIIKMCPLWWSLFLISGTMVISTENLMWINDDYFVSRLWAWNMLPQEISCKYSVKHIFGSMCCMGTLDCFTCLHCKFIHCNNFFFFFCGWGPGLIPP